MVQSSLMVPEPAGDAMLPSRVALMGIIAHRKKKQIFVTE